MDACDRWERLDILHNNVGISVAGGDAEISKIEGEAWTDHGHQPEIHGVAIKHALQSCAATSISPRQRRMRTIPVTYKASKAAAKAMTEQVALQNAPHGIRQLHPAGMTTRPWP